jgi:hypothetical protein
VAAAAARTASMVLTYDDHFAKVTAEGSQALS